MNQRVNILVMKEGEEAEVEEDDNHKGEARQEGICHDGSNTE